VGPEEVEVDEDIIEVGRAQGRAVKGEDTLYVRGILDGPADQRTLCAAVFDGHGGKAASAAALKTVGDRLMDHGPPFSDALIADAFWQADQALGEAGEMSGTTATVCFLEPCDGALAGVLAWVGDSAALHVDMHANPDQAITFATPLHNPENPAEVQRIATLSATRAALSKSIRSLSPRCRRSSSPRAVTKSPAGARSHSLCDTASQRNDSPMTVRSRAECTDEQAAAALEMVMGAPPSPSKVRRLQRELYRERWIMEKEQAVTALEAELANGGSESNGSLPKAPGSGERRRRSTNIGHRFGASRGPLVLKATLHQGDVNTRVTRSIGDWDAARSCIPEPELRRFTIARGTHSRLLLASDGLWDVISPAQACRLVRGAATAQRAADLLLGMAERISNEKFGRLKDDTTVLVVDVDLRTEAMRQAAKREGSCCVVC